MHGIGFGCVPYIGVALRAASRQPRRTIVLPEWPNLSFGTYRGRYPSTRELAWTLHQHLRRLVYCDGTPATVADAVGHSYGTGVLTFWMREVNNIAGRSTRLVVPIRSFVLHACRGSLFSR